VQPVIERGMRNAYGKQLAGVDAGALAAAGRALVEAEPMTFSQLARRSPNAGGIIRRTLWPGRARVRTRSCRCRRGRLEPVRSVAAHVGGTLA